MIDKPIPGAYWVVPGRFLAGEYPGSTRGEQALTRSRLAAFLDASFDAFFDLTRPGELPSYQAALQEQAEARGLTVDYSRSGIPDKGLPAAGQMSALLEAIDAALDAGRKVYVHCWGGIGRTGTTVGCWLVRHGRTGEAALARLNELYRTSEQSRFYDHSPETGEQQAFVRGWEAHCCE
jgi:hypothetical protein